MAAAGPELTEVPSWRVDMLFFALVLVTFILTKADHVLLTYLEKQNKLGYIHIYEALKEELLLVGVVSLLLTGVQDKLQAICVSTPWLDSVMPSFDEKAATFAPPSPPYAVGGYDGSYSGVSSYPPPAEGYEYSSRRLLSSMSPSTVAARWRNLLAAGDDYGGCPEGQSSLFPASALHAIHIMLFLVAATQIVYSLLVLMLCLWKVRMWRKHEKLAQEEAGLLKHIDNEGGCTGRLRGLKRRAVEHLSSKADKNMFVHYAIAFVLMFVSVDSEQYIVLRHIFIHQLGLDNDFDFNTFVRESMEEEFASLVEINSFMWVILFIWIALPPETYVSIWMPLMFFAMAMVLGTKLSSIMIMFNQRAKQAWANSFEATQEISRNSAEAVRTKSGPLAESKEYQAEQGDVELGQQPAGDRAVPLFGPSSSETHASSQSENMKADENVEEGKRSAGRGCCWGPQVDGSDSDEDEADSGDEVAVKVKVREGKSWKKIEVDEKTLKMLSGKKWIQRQYHNASTDSAKLFWGRKPFIILKLLQFVYFGMSMQLAIDIFSAWMGLPAGYLCPVFGSVEEIYTTVYASVGSIIFQLFTNIFVLMWCSFILLPVYALVSTVGSHCPGSVLEYARKNALQPKLTKALQAVAMLNQLNEMDIDDAASVSASEVTMSIAPSGPPSEVPEVMESLIDDIIDAHLENDSAVSGHGHVQSRSVQKLMGAMYSAQLKRLQEDRRVGASPSHSNNNTWHSGAAAKATGALPRPSSHKSLSQVMGLFEEANQQAAEGLDSALSQASTAIHSEITPSRRASSSGVSSSPSAARARLAEKKELLLSIVDRQERLRRVSKDPEGEAPEVGSNSESRSKAPLGFSLSRHSMTGRVSLDRSAPVEVSSAGASSARRNRPPTGFSLSRSSAKPRLETISSPPKSVLESHPEHPEEGDGHHAPDPSLKLARESM